MIFSIVLFLLSLSLVAGQVVLTIDDVPFAWGEMSTWERSQQLIKSIPMESRSKIWIFANCPTNEAGKKQIASYHSAGIKIGNHTAHHVESDKVAAAEFIREIELANQCLQPWLSSPIVFRFPALIISNDIEKQQTILSYLQQQKILPGIVTIDSLDWYVGKLIEEARQRGELVDLAKMQSLWFQNLVDQLNIGWTKSPLQVILLHERDITARSLHQLFIWLEQNGHQVVSMLDAEKYYRRKSRSFGEANFYPLLEEMGKLAITQRHWLDQQVKATSAIRKASWIEKLMMKLRKKSL